MTRPLLKAVPAVVRFAVHVEPGQQITAKPLASACGKAEATGQDGVSQCLFRPGRMVIKPSVQGVFITDIEYESQRGAQRRTRRQMPPRRMEEGEPVRWPTWAFAANTIGSGVKFDVVQPGETILIVLDNRGDLAVDLQIEIKGHATSANRVVQLNLGFPDWVREIDDPCLSETLREALVARFQAVRAGAMARRGTQEALAAGDATMAQIEYGRVRGQIACRKAATALRKYTQALSDAEPAKRRYKRERRS